jgi:hypothetical protein
MVPSSPTYTISRNAAPTKPHCRITRNVRTNRIINVRSIVRGIIGYLKIISSGIHVRRVASYDCNSGRARPCYSITAGHVAHVRAVIVEVPPVTVREVIVKKLELRRRSSSRSSITGRCGRNCTRRSWTDERRNKTEKRKLTNQNNEKHQANIKSPP